ncbi:hypothetical protein QR685DRAFT_52280 [Neurospora intermedia]|uniref:Uncharacterized protein n=1 Tax=Neurospora intermedia TaxID=5142 RepID=A0ABR3DTB8_NEUIN
MLAVVVIIFADLHLLVLVIFSLFSGFNHSFSLFINPPTRHFSWLLSLRRLFARLLFKSLFFFFWVSIPLQIPPKRKETFASPVFPPPIVSVLSFLDEYATIVCFSTPFQAAVSSDIQSPPGCTACVTWLRDLGCLH